MSNCEIELDLTWSRNYIISEISKTAEVTGNPNANLPVLAKTAILKTSPLFQINSVKLCFSVDTLSVNDKTKFLENVKQEFKRTFFWNRYKYEITTPPKKKDLDYMFDPVFRNIKVICSFIQKCDNDPIRTFFNECYMSLIEIKDFNPLIDNSLFFDQSVKSMSRNNETMPIKTGCATGNLLGYLYHQNYYKLIGIDLSRKLWLFPDKLISEENQKKIMVRQCVLLLKNSKKPF